MLWWVSVCCTVTSGSGTAVLLFFLQVIKKKNNNPCKKNMAVRTEIISQKGKKISTDKTTKSIDADKISFIKQVLPVIKKPKLWSPETPHLYNAITKIYLDKNLIDIYQTTFGIRSFRWCADEGFFLNGKHYYLFGANVHQDQAGWGDAVTNGAIRRDVQLMKDAGFNCIRGSHYPHDPGFIEACD